MGEQALRVMRKVKINDKWILAAVPMVKGKPDPAHVLHKGKLVAVNAGTFYLDHGHGKDRKRFTCGGDAESVRRAMRTQAHVIELRRQGMEVDDAPEIAGRGKKSITLRAIARDFKAEPPTAFAKKTISKYDNAHETFAEFAAIIGVYGAAEVTKKTVARWIAHMQKLGLDGSTIVPKVRIVLAQLKERGNEIILDDKTLPPIVEKERDIYTPAELDAIFRACDLERVT